MKFSVFVAISFTLAVSALPQVHRRSSFDLQNGQDAIAQNTKFASLTPDSACTEGEDACVNSGFAQCVNGKFVVQPCGPGTICAALPLVNSPGTSIACTTQADLDARLAATGATSGSSSAAVSSAAATSAAASSVAASSVAASSVAASSVAASSVATTSVAVSSTVASSAAAASSTASSGGNDSGSNDSDAQSSLTLDPHVLATGFENNGQNVPAAGQVASATSSNNFINFCLTVNLPLTNGTQIPTGSCNPAPMGVIVANTSMPSSKFVNPQNFGTIPANQNFTIVMNIANMETGHFVNADENYFAAPQTVNAEGLVQGHSHVVIEAISSYTQTTPTNPSKFQFFKGLNDVAVNGQLSVEVPGGIPAGTYRLASINTAANHQPVLVSVAQHGGLDDMIYFKAE